MKRAAWTALRAPKVTLCRAPRTRPRHRAAASPLALATSQGRRGEVRACGAAGTAPWSGARHRATALLLGLVLAACSTDTKSKGPVCEARLQRACPCIGGGEGVQVCDDDGSKWLACQGCEADGSDVADAADATDSPDVPDDEVTADVAEDTTATPETATPSDVPPSGTCLDCGYGSLKGIVCAPSEQIFVSNATLTIETTDCDGNPLTVTTTSNADGTYLMEEVPCGQHTVHVKAGSFENSYPVTIEAGEETDITGVGKKQCFKAQTVNIAVFWGQWDHQHELLDELGFEYTWYGFEWEFFNDVPPQDIEAVQVLRDPDLLAQHQILFFNCGSAALEYVHLFPLYASDLSWAYIEAAFPNAFDFYGDDDLPNTAQAPDGPQKAVGNQDVPATVIDPVLAEKIGTTVFTAKYGSGPLIVVDEAAPGGAVHVKGPVDLNEDVGPFDPPKKHAGPLVMSRKPTNSSGSLVYTTFHNDEQADALMETILYYLVFLL